LFAEVGKLEVKAPAMTVVGNVILGREFPPGKESDTTPLVLRSAMGVAWRR
jgi:hypothetical protein